MSKSLLIVAFIWAALATSCYTDSSNGKCAGKREHELETLCKNILDTGAHQSRQLHQRTSADFNPRNSNELVFIKSFYRANEVGYITHLYHYNRSTKKKKALLYNMENTVEPGYGPHDWIGVPNRFGGIDFVHTQKDSSFHWPGEHFKKVIWNDDGSQVCFLTISKPNSIHLILSWPSLTITDSLLGIIPHFQWGNKGNGFYASTTATNKIHELSMADQKWIRVAYNEGELKTKFDGAIRSFEIDETTNNIYFVKNELLKYDATRNCEIKLKGTCKLIQYSNVQLSPDGTELLTTRFTPPVETENGVEYNGYDLYVMDLDGCNERKLIID